MTTRLQGKRSPPLKARIVLRKPAREWSRARPSSQGAGQDVLHSGYHYFGAENEANQRAHLIPALRVHDAGSHQVGDSKETFQRN